MGDYNTAQKTLLIAYLKNHSNRAYTVDELIECMQKEYSGSTIPGKSTIYRIMPALVKDGIVKRFAKDNSRQFLYQMICGEDCGSHLHLKCSVCGKIYHMNVVESKGIIEEILRRNGFRIDERKTMLFGLCKECLK